MKFTPEYVQEMFDRRYEYVKNSYSIRLCYELLGWIQAAHQFSEWKGGASASAKVCRELINNPEYFKKCDV